MSGQIQFETPENVQVSYKVAGLGTRFIAWLIDAIILLGIMVIFLICAIVFALANDRILQGFLDGNGKPAASVQTILFALGMFILVLGLGSFFYYGLSEFFMKGQTLGKRAVSLRVVKSNGFTLDATSILLRNIFRILDNVPVVWIVPIMSERSQRFGDMVAGTLIVSDKPDLLNPLRESLLERNPSEYAFQFSNAQLTRARPGDFEAVEKLLERWETVKPVEREKLLQMLCEPLAKRIEATPPEPTQRLAFLQDFLSAEFRRQYRQLS